MQIRTIFKVYTTSSGIPPYIVFARDIAHAREIFNRYHPSIYIHQVIPLCYVAIVNPHELWN